MLSLNNVNIMPRLYLIHQMTPKYKVAYGVNTIENYNAIFIQKANFLPIKA